MDLFLEDVGKDPWVKDVIDWGRSIVKFIYKIQKPLAIFRDHSTLELLKPGTLVKTCYQSLIIG